MKILILAETIDPSDSSAGKANYALIDSLVITGIELKVYHYSYKEHELQDVKPILIRERKADLFYWLSRGQRVLQRLASRNFSRLLENRFGFSFTFFNDVNSMYYALKAVSVNDYDLVLTLSKGASYRTHAALLKLPQWHKKWLAYIHDPYPFQWYPKPYDWIQPGYLQKEKFFEKVAQKAQWLGYPSKSLQEWMANFDPNFEIKGIVLPHQPSKEALVGAVFPNFFIPQHFNVLHAGNLLKQRDPFPLIQAWNFFIKKCPEAKGHAKLLLIGPGGYHEPQLSEACGESSTLYRYPGSMDYDTVRLLEHHSTINVILEAVAETSPFLPAKFPNLINAKRPILHLGPEKSEVRRLLGADYRYASDADNVAVISNRLIELYDCWRENRLQLPETAHDLDAYFHPGYLQDILHKLKT
ncbi:UDP-glycosyltransferase [Leeuwenhoekiella parthenopeia]|uniref:UDP-glycosyltransferase n=1 Tax=Leeuwenhoekiella parthenopeia TaxID=2890320 RepID=A0ABS8GXA9_9FLAO|nr:UDP-glycosyltransferase [Leeuwenhoekiella parthenopeia]MCC4214652.1 UDP-glycosyltransferase [Leeuwenhoekiella parthenopeia]